MRAWELKKQTSNNINKRLDEPANDEDADVFFHVLQIRCHKSCAHAMRY